MSHRPPEEADDSDPSLSDSDPSSPDDAETRNSSSDASDHHPRGDGARRKPFVVRHKALTAAAVVLVLLVSSAGGYLYWANQQLAAIPRVPAGIIPDPEKDHNEGGKPLNILMLGADHGDVGESVAEDLEDGEWTPGQHLSDTIIVAHIPADRDTAQLISLPRDSWVKVDGLDGDDGYSKINAAFSTGGPARAVATVEDLTGMKIDHVAIIDWAGFRDLTSAVGGVRVFIPEGFTDTSQNVTWDEGYITLKGEPALQYVRTRHDLPGPVKDDFGRIARQQNFLRALMGKLLSNGTTNNPVRFGKVLNTLTRFLTVDETWDTDEIRGLALSMRSIGSEDVDFVTAANVGFGDSETAGNYVKLDMRKLRQLINAVEADDVDRYLDRNPEQRLADEKSVN